MKLRTNVNPNYKTKKCIQFYENGYCPYGSRCQFLHKNEPQEEKIVIKPSSGNLSLSNNTKLYSPQVICGFTSKEETYKRLLEEFSKSSINVIENNVK